MKDLSFIDPFSECLNRGHFRQILHCVQDDKVGTFLVVQRRFYCQGDLVR